MSDDRTTVLLAGDPSLADAITEPDGSMVEIIGRVTTGNEAVGVVLSDLPDVVLVDTRIEDPDIRAVCRRLREWAPATKVLAVTALDDERAYTSVVAGAVGAVFLHDSPDTVADAVRRVAAGESILQSRMAMRLLHDLDEWARRSADPLYPPPTLTATEREVLGRLGEGTDAATVATLHGVTAHLVNLHARFAVTKLHRFVLGAERVAAEQG